MNVLTGLQSVATPTPAEAQAAVAGAGAPQQTPQAENAPQQSAPTPGTPAQATPDSQQAPGTPQGQPPAQGGQPPAQTENEAFRAKYNQFVTFLKDRGGQEAFDAFKNNDPNYVFPTTTQEPGVQGLAQQEQPPAEKQVEFDPFNKEQFENTVKDAARKMFQEQKTIERQTQLKMAVENEKVAVQREFAKFSQGIPQDVIDAAIARTAVYNIDVNQPGGWSSSAQAVLDMVEMELSRRGMLTATTQAQADGANAGKLVAQMSAPDSGGVAGEAAPQSDKMRKLQAVINSRSAIDEFLSK